MLIVESVLINCQSWFWSKAGSREREEHVEKDHGTTIWHSTIFHKSSWLSISIQYSSQFTHKEISIEQSLHNAAVNSSPRTRKWNANFRADPEFSRHSPTSGTLRQVLRKNHVHIHAHTLSHSHTHTHTNTHLSTLKELSLHSTTEKGVFHLAQADLIPLTTGAHVF